MWLFLGILSALCLGCYDISRKHALDGNPATLVLLSSVVCSTLLLCVPLALSRIGVLTAGSQLFYVPQVSADAHRFIFIKAVIVLTSWLLGYQAMQHLPISFVSPMNATRPVWTLIGALTLFGERLNIWQWAGVAAAFAAIAYMQYGFVKVSSNRISVRHNAWVWCLIGAIITGAISGLYDKYLMRRFDHNAVQVWYTIYQCALMAAIVLVMLWRRKIRQPFKWKWSIALISLFLVMSDYVYFYALTYPDALISVLSTTRRMGFVVPFFYGLMLLREPVSKYKLIGTLAVVVSMVLLLIGTM